MFSFQIEYDDRARAQSLKEQESKNLGEAKPIVAEAPKIVAPGDDEEEDDDESDLDIDNI